ncbi:MAG: phage terminase large subunit [Hyphomicrobiales bacterium]|jgi:predicted phage terminase large subunit-like protein|nr:phage terminase large subunit [Hyphomicrobiales bacterium]
MNIDTKKLIQTKFLAFAMKAFATINKGKSLGNDKYLKLLAERLTRVAAGETKRLVVSLPPRHFKTFMGSICLPAWILAHNSSAKIVILTYGQDLADKNAYAIREILRSDWFQQAFRTRMKRDRAKLVDFATTDGGGVRSLSIEGGVTGLGADYIIIDDPVEIKDCDNTKRLERVNELFDNEIQTRLDNPKKGCIVIIAHRISENDLPGHLLQKNGWKQLKLPLIATCRRKYDLGDAGVWVRKKGELLRRDAFTKRDIQRLRGSKQPGFESLQQQNPGGSDRLRIKAKYFPTFPSAELPMRELPVVLSIDPGQKSGPENSFTVIQVWCSKDGAHLLLDQWRKHAHYRKVRRAVKRFIGKYRPSVVLIEATGQGPALLSEIKPQNGMELVGITPVGDKVERLRKHRLTIRRGLVQLAQGASWYGEFIREATEFPYGSFDDQMDALSQYLTWIADHPNPPKRPPLATIQRGTTQGRPAGAGTQTNGIAVARRSRQMFNVPFPRVKTWVKY